MTIVNLNHAREIVDDDWELLHDLVALFLEVYPQQINTLATAVSTHDPLAIQQAAHRIKGSVGNIGGTAASELAFQLEVMGHEGLIPPNAPELFQQLQEAITAVATFYHTFNWPHQQQEPTP